MRRRFLLLALLLTACGDRTPAQRVVLGTTHTVEDSGLLQVLVDAFETEHPDTRLATVVAGSGEILEYGRRGDVDVLLTHSPEDEQAFLAGGHGEARLAVMSNRFVLVGPAEDPADAVGADDAGEALRRIEQAGAPFISRGDDSGTHRRERALWAHAQRIPSWPGYAEAGVGMAETLRLAAQRNAYTLADRATFEALRAELGMRIVQREGDRLENSYSVIIVTRAAAPEGARRFANWVRSPAAAALIEGFGRDADGAPLFTPAAR